MINDHSGKLHANGLIGDCADHRPQLAPDGEYVCTRCGAVLSEGNDWALEAEMTPPTAAQAPTTKSNVNLFLAHKLGGSEVRSLPGLSTLRGLEMANREGAMKSAGGRKRKKKSANAYLSMFSNACSKLELTPAESEYAWRLFARLYAELATSDDSRVTNTSEIACYAISAGALATTRRLLDERHLARAVMFSFRSKSVRDMYCIRRIIETRSQSLTGAARPALTASARWLRGRL